MWGTIEGRWVLAKPNKSVKATRRPLEVLKFSFYQGSVVSFRFR
jgi:hypothetical protein